MRPLGKHKRSGVMAAAFAAGVVLVAGTPFRAEANGRFPAALQLVVDPVTPEHIAVRATFGILESRDEGTSWRWICEQAITPAGFADPPFAMASDGTLLVGLTDGVRHGVNGGCDWQNAGGDVDGQAVADLALDPTHPSRVYAMHQHVDGSSTVLTKSEDNGASFHAVGAPEPDFLPFTLDVAPSDSQRIYLSGIAATGNQALFLRSTDGGQHFARLTFPSSSSPFIAAIDPFDADRVYVRDLGETSALYVTEDGGVTFTRLFASKKALTAFALAPDGLHMAAGSQDDGLVVVTRTPGDGGVSAFSVEPVRPLGAQCFTWTAAGLYACGTEAVDGFSVARSGDGMSSFVPLLRFAELTPLVCDQEKKSAVCAGYWCNLRRKIADASCEMDVADAALDAAEPLDGLLPEAGQAHDAGLQDASLGASAPTPVSMPSGGCGCRVTSRRAGAWGGLALLGFGVVAHARRRRAPRS